MFTKFLNDGVKSEFEAYFKSNLTKNMMEEVSDDTNGESTFEFVNGKSDENTLKESSTPGDVKADENVTPQSFPPPPPTFATPLTSVLSPRPQVSTTKEQQNVSFYNPVTTPNLFTPLQTNPAFQPLAPAPGLFTESQNWNPSTIPVSQTPTSILDPTLTQCSISLPGAESVPPTILPESNNNDGGGGVWGWIKGNQLLNKVAEKAKNSVDSVITTLDPGMKEIINTGGDVNVIVATGNEDKISAVREAFQLIFGKATVQGIAVQSSSIAPQPVGVSAGLKAAEERISNLRQQGYLDGNHVVIAIENFITELTPDNWFDMGCLLLQDSYSGISLQVYTQAIPISSLYVAQAKDQTPADYPLGWSGHAITIGQIVGSALGVHHSEWHQALTGVSRREILFLAAKSIAGLYRMQLRR